MQSALFQTEVPPNPTMQNLLPLYRNHLWASKRTRHTIETYLRVLERLSGDAGRPRGLCSWTTHALEAFVAGLREADRADKTVEVAVSAIKSFFKWSCVSGLLTADPARKLLFPMAELRLPDIPRLREVEKIIRTAAASTHKDVLLVLLFSEGGLKREEALRLTADHFDCADPFRIRVSIPSPKPRKVRTVYLSKEYTNRVEACTKPSVGDHPPLYACAPEALSAKVEALGRAAGIARRITPMTLRHFCAVRMLKAGRTIEEVHAYLGLAAPKDCPIMRDLYLALVKLPL